MNIPQELDRLADRLADIELIRAEKDAGRGEILARVQPELDALDFAYADSIAVLRSEADILEADIRAAVLALGKSPEKGSRLQAVYAKGRITWDTKGIEGLAKAYPVLLDFRKVGLPSVSFRAVK